MEESIQVVDKIEFVDKNEIIHEDHHGNQLCLNDIRTEHLINILRRMVNAFAREVGLSSILIKNPVADCEFDINDEYLQYFLAYTTEVENRMKEEEVRECYRIIFRKVKKKTYDISKYSDLFINYTIEEVKDTW